jgi:hypothetical protein
VAETHAPCWGGLKSLVGRERRAAVVDRKAVVREAGVQAASRRIIGGTDRQKFNRLKHGRRLWN